MMFCKPTIKLGGFDSPHEALMASHLNVAALLSLSLRCVRISCNSWSYLGGEKMALARSHETGIFRPRFS